MSAEPSLGVGAALERGRVEFNRGRFFEAHEVWESSWIEEIGDERKLLQGLVQAAAGFHKAEIGVPGGARKLFVKALGVLEELPCGMHGLDLQSFRDEIRQALEDRRSTAPRLRRLP